MPNDYGLGDAEYSRDMMNPPEYEPNLPCDHCGKGIYEGEEYYSINGENLCEDCVSEIYGVTA